MLKVLLVDDEYVITQGLSVLIDWGAEGYEIAAVCSNGQDALDYLRENAVDLVIADVMMPVMTGLELLEKVKGEKVSDASFVILSGYSEFAFAQQAMRFGCIDYLLKPIERDDLLAILHKFTHMSEDAKRDQQYEQAYLTRKLIALLYGRSAEADIAYIRSNMHLSAGVRYIEIEIANVGEFDEEETNMHALREQIHRNCRQILQEDSSHCVLEISHRRLNYAAGFIYCDYMAQERNLTEVQYIQMIHRHIGISLQREIRLLVGKKVADIEMIAQSYESAASLRNLEAFRSQEHIYFYEHELQSHEEKNVLCKRELDALIKSIELGDHDRIEGQVEALFSRMQSKGIRRKGINVNFNYLLFRLVHLASNIDSEADQEEILQLISTSAVEQGFLRGSSRHLARFACEYSDYLAQLQRNESSGILGNIEREIRENYAENLTLQELGKKYFINSSYLGQIFKKAYGQSFKNYLALQRITEASRLLVCTDKKIGDIAEAEGYKDIDYFISKFIQIKGCTPSRFRRNRV